MTKQKKQNIIYWISTLWLSLGMIATGYGQLINMSEGQGGMNMITHLGYPIYLLTILGICKVLGTIAILIPRFPLLKEWAYAGLFFLMAGAIYSHLAVNDQLIDIMPATLLIILIIISWIFRPESRKVSTKTNIQRNL